MEIMTQPQTGLFPAASEITCSCSCPDDADLCPHSAAVLYGTAVRLDEAPELLFQLRGVDPGELIVAVTAPQADGPGRDVEPPSTDTPNNADTAASGLAGVDLGALFGIELTMDSDASCE
jgi:uncharacterized Zn finger protein